MDEQNATSEQPNAEQPNTPGPEAEPTPGAEPAADLAETAAQPSALDRMVGETIDLLTRLQVPGEGGEKGVYNSELITSCCQKMMNGAVHADTGYGITVSRQYYETAKLL